MDYGEFICVGCQTSKEARINSTSHLKPYTLTCPAVAIILNNSSDSKVQTRIDTPGGKVVISFSKERFWTMLTIWISASEPNFTLIENPLLQAVFKLANPDPVLPSADTISRRLYVMYEKIEAKVDQDLLGNTPVLHYAHDAWTDSAHRNSYLAIYVSYIDKNFEYKEVLLRLMHFKRSHTGARLGKGLFQLFDGLGIAERIGPGTADNASNNITAAEHLADRRSGMLYINAKNSNVREEFRVNADDPKHVPTLFFASSRVV